MGDWSHVFILGVFFTSAVWFAMMLMVEQSSSTKPATSLSLHLRVLMVKSCSVHSDPSRLLKALQKDINNVILLV